MPFDLAAHLGLVTRTVRNLERDGKPVKAIIASCVYDTDAADLWDAVTNAERLPRWFLPVSGDLRLGGRYQFTGNAGGKITECVPQKRLAATWEFGGGVTWVTVTLSPEGDRNATPARARRADRSALGQVRPGRRRRRLGARSCRPGSPRRRAGLAGRPGRRRQMAGNARRQRVCPAFDRRLG